MSSRDSDEWPEDMLEEMAKMLEQMGMPIDIKALEQMMKRVMEQFEQMGIDPTKISHSEFKFESSTDSEEFRRAMESMFDSQGGFQDFFKRMGVNVDVKSNNQPQEEVEAEVEKSEDSEISDLPEEDAFVSDGQMSISIDISRFLDIRSEDLELLLSGGGEVLQLLRRTQARPFKRFILPEAVEDILDWELNNGILDITFDLV
ncbi:MAG: hypothetical protein VX204_00455 [Candidatus Thermoplasmatota archaeon]|nr:hypothetical protein [Candidatus Thermoplasmatota archaeon]